MTTRTIIHTNTAMQKVTFMAPIANMTTEVAVSATAGPASTSASADTPALLQLIWLASPALPIGGFSYSEGLEAAIDQGFVHDEHSAADWQLQHAMTLSAKVIAVQQLQAGDAVGYGSSFRADGPMRVGVVACGYADGYPRICPTGTPVLVDGARSRTLGRVSMDMLVVDLSDLPQAGFGSTVTLWGQATNGARLSIDEVAAQAGTVGYELMCALAQRVPVFADPL